MTLIAYVFQKMNTAEELVRQMISLKSPVS